MKSSCVKHPANAPMAIIRDEYVQACDGNICAALLLNHFEYWHNIKLDQKRQSKKYNDIAESHGEERAQLETCLQFHSTEDLEKAIFAFKKDKIREALILLERKEFIFITKNPNERYSFDRTKYFLFIPENVNFWLEENYFNESDDDSDMDIRILDNRSAKNRQSSTKNLQRDEENRPLKAKNRQTITEITPENTTEGGREAPTPSFSFGEGMEEEISEFINLWNQEFGDRPERIKSTSPQDTKKLSQFIENAPEWRDYLVDGIKGYCMEHEASEGKDWGYMFHPKNAGMLDRLVQKYRAKQNTVTEDSEPDEYGLTMQDYKKGLALVKTWEELGKVDKTEEFKPVVSHTLHQFLKAGYKLVPFELSFKVVSEHLSKSFDLYNTSAFYAKMLFDQFVTDEQRIIEDKELLEEAKTFEFPPNALKYGELYVKNMVKDKPTESLPFISPKLIYFLALKSNKQTELRVENPGSGKAKVIAEDPLDRKKEIYIFPYCSEESVLYQKREVLKLKKALEASPQLLTTY